MSRFKGVKAEQNAARILQLVYGLHDAQRRCAGDETRDTAPGRDLEATPGLCVQVKETGSPSPLSALEEAEHASRDQEIPIAIVRQSRRGSSTPFRVVMPIEDAMLLLELRARFTECYPKRVEELRADLYVRIAALRETLPHLFR